MKNKILSPMQNEILARDLYDNPANPSLDEVIRFVNNTMLHSQEVEYYLNKLGIRVDDGQHPHDLVGKGNKLEWEVIRGLALRKNDAPEKQKIFENSLLLHRKGQIHHHKFGVYNPHATPDEMRYGAIDAVCSLRECREYQGGAHSWEKVEEAITRNAEYKRPWMTWAMGQIKKLEANQEGFYKGDKRDT